MKFEVKNPDYGKSPYTCLLYTSIAPMDKEGNIDYELLKAQVQFQLDHKIHAIFVSGLTECMVTSVDEQIEMLRETVKTVNGQVPVMGNICLNRPEDALTAIKAFEEAGADAVSIAPVSYTHLITAVTVKSFCGNKQIIC